MGITLRLTGIAGEKNDQLIKSSNGINVNVVTKQDLTLQYGLGDTIIRPGTGKTVRVVPTFGPAGDGPLRYDVNGEAICFAFYTANDAALRVVWFSVSGPKPGSNVQNAPTVSGATSYHEVNFVYNAGDTEFYITMANELAAVVAGIPGVVSAIATDEHCDIIVGVGTTSDPYIVYPAGFIIPSVDQSEEIVLISQNSAPFFDVSGVGKYLQMYSTTGGEFFWFKVSGGANTQTAPSGVGTAHEVDILITDTSEDISNAIEAAILDTSSFSTNRLTEVAMSAIVLIAGAVIDATAETSGFIAYAQSQGGLVGSAFLTANALNEGLAPLALGQVTSVDFRLRQYVYDNNSANETLPPWNGDGKVNWSFNAGYNLMTKDSPSKSITMISKDNTTRGAYLTVSISTAIFVLAGSKKSDYGLGSGLFAAGEVFEGSFTQTTVILAHKGIKQNQTIHYHVYCINPAWISTLGGSPSINISGRFDKLDDITTRSFGPIGNISLSLTYTRNGLGAQFYPKFVEKEALVGMGVGYKTGDLKANSPTVNLKSVTV